MYHAYVSVSEQAKEYEPNMIKDGMQEINRKSACWYSNTPPAPWLNISKSFRPLPTVEDDIPSPQVASGRDCSGGITKVEGAVEYKPAVDSNLELCVVLSLALLSEEFTVSSHHSGPDSGPSATAVASKHDSWYTEWREPSPKSGTKTGADTFRFAAADK